MLDAAGRIAWANPAAASLLEVSTPAALIGRPFGRVITTDGGARMSAPGSGTAPIPLDVRQQEFDLEGRPMQLVTLRTAPDDEPSGGAGLRDPLTGLPNRVLLHDRMERLAARLRRRGRPGRFGVLYIDLDRFKEINDALGHGVGDQILVSVADRLEACLRPSDTVARIGGDEFAVLLTDVPRSSGLARAARRILHAFEEPFRVNGRTIRVGLTIGATLAVAERSPDALLDEADQALYAAKAGGRGRMQIFDLDMHERAQQRISREEGLREAVRSRSLSVAYQPIVDLRSGHVLAVEALLRWPGAPGSREGGTAELVRTAEEIGVIGQIDLWVLETALGRLARWRTLAGCEQLKLHVNLSEGALLDTGLSDKVLTLMDRLGLPVGALVVEIGEQVLGRDGDDATRHLAQLAEAGIGVVVHNYTGGISPTRLQAMPTVGVKIHRDFVADDESLLTSLAALAKGLEIPSAAEGVETRDAATRAVAKGCGSGQGFFFSPPLPAEAVAPALSDGALTVRW